LKMMVLKKGTNQIYELRQNIRNNSLLPLLFLVNNSLFLPLLNKFDL